MSRIIRMPLRIDQKNRTITNRKGTKKIKLPDYIDPRKLVSIYYRRVNGRIQKFYFIEIASNAFYVMHRRKKVAEFTKDFKHRIVDEKFRGIGLADAALKVYENDLKKRGYKLTQQDTSVISTLLFFLSHGYKINETSWKKIKKKLGFKPRRNKDGSINFVSYKLLRQFLKKNEFEKTEPIHLKNLKGTLRKLQKIKTTKDNEKLWKHRTRKLKREIKTETKKLKDIVGFNIRLEKEL